jgi:hypothetical protein
MIRIDQLKEETARVVRRVISETYIRKTRRSSRVKLGSCTPVLINPTMKDTQNEAQSLLNHAKGEIAAAYRWANANKQSAVIFHNKDKNHVTFRGKRQYDQIDAETKKNHRILKVIHPEHVDYDVFSALIR